MFFWGETSLGYSDVHHPKVSKCQTKIQYSIQNIATFSYSQHAAFSRFSYVLDPCLSTHYPKEFQQKKSRASKR